MTDRQLRCARAWLGMSTRDIAKVLGCSAMAISKIERGSLKNGPLIFGLMLYYKSQGIAFYAGGCIESDSRPVQDYANALRERLLLDGSGSAYILAFDKIVEKASGSARRKR